VLDIGGSLGKIKALSGQKTVTGSLVGNVGPSKIATRLW